jgi:hypothetical protein
MVAHNLRPSILGVFIILMMMKAFMPLGFMPDFKSSAPIAITICSGVDEVQIFVDENGQKVPVPQNTKHQKQSPCNFSIASLYTTTDITPFANVNHFAIGFEYPIAYAPSLHVIDKHSFQSQAPPALV